MKALQPLGHVFKDGQLAEISRVGCQRLAVELVPFAVEALGRPGRAAVFFLRSVAPADPEQRSAVLGSAWQSLSVLLQTENAELLLSSAGSGGGGGRPRGSR